MTKKTQSSARFTKAADMLRLALEFQASAEGLSLEDIQLRFKVERRTAERMRDAVREVFPRLEEVDTGERKKRWRLPSRTLQSLISFTADELAAIHLASGILKRDRRIEASKSLSAVETKIIGLLPKDAHRKVTVDLEALAEAEGLAFRPGPKVNIDQKIIGQIRNAILARKEIKIRYKRRDSGEVHELDCTPSTGELIHQF
jgi:predicted DNA-binding transcriptional regulator YafY